MSAFRPIFRSILLQHHRSRSKLFTCSRRTLLSPAYACSSVWEARRESPILKDLDPYDFMSEIQRQTQKGHAISAIDIDVLLNCISDTEQFDEAVRLLYKFRHRPKAAEMLDSTHSAFVHTCIQHGHDEALLRILDDPINYGVFLDSHDANLLMDHFLKNGNHRDAARVASKIMLQEDFDRESTCWLAAFSCLKWIKEPLPDAAAEGAAEEGAEGASQEDEEEILFRLPYLKNHYFDDHFDIAEFPQLFGKTLAWTARSLKNKQLSSNLMALGYGIKKDYKNLASVLRRQLETKTPLFAEVESLIFASKATEEPASEEATPPKEPTATEDGSPTEESEKAEAEADADLEEVKTLIEQFHQGDLLINEDLEETLSEELNNVLPELESNDIKERTSKLHEWNDKQQTKIENQVLRYLKKERIKEIVKERQAVIETEEYLNFFENRTKLESSVHPELLKQEEEAKLRIQAEKQQLPSDDKYVIPELRVKREEEKINF